MAPRILIVEERDSLREEIERSLASERCEIVAVTGAGTGLRRIDVRPIDIIVVGRETLANGGDGLLHRLARSFPESTLVVAGGEVGLAAEAVRWGAHDILVMPLQPDAARLTLRRSEERGRLRCRNHLLERDVRRLGDDRPIVASSPPMIGLLEAIERIAAYSTPVLFSGETGSGLEILARAIHAQSARRNRPFVALHCRSASAERLQAELIGFGRTGAAETDRAAPGLLAGAEGGSLFLDEISALPESLQIALLGVVREEQWLPVGASKPSPVDVRLLAATSLGLEAELAAGRFHRGLFDALGPAHLAVPPLRERSSDIPLLVDHFLERACERYGVPVPAVSGDAMARLVAYDWPGNVRELEITLERTVMLSPGDRITSRDLPDGLLSATRGPPTPGRRAGFCLRTARKDLEADMIRQVLRATDGNRTRAAELLNVSHRTLLYKIKEYGVRD